MTIPQAALYIAVGLAAYLLGKHVARRSRSWSGPARMVFGGMLALGALALAIVVTAGWR